jgi:hypothetical protein
MEAPIVDPLSNFAEEDMEGMKIRPGDLGPKNSETKA